MSDSDHGKAVLDALNPLHRELRRAIPAVYAGFSELHHAAFAPGAFDTKTKELIAVEDGYRESAESWPRHEQAVTPSRR